MTAHGRCFPVATKSSGRSDCAPSPAATTNAAECAYFGLERPVVNVLYTAPAHIPATTHRSATTAVKPTGGCRAATSGFEGKSG